MKVLLLLKRSMTVRKQVGKNGYGSTTSISGQEDGEVSSKYNATTGIRFWFNMPISYCFYFYMIISVLVLVLRV